MINEKHSTGTGVRFNLNLLSPTVSESCIILFCKSTDICTGIIFQGIFYTGIEEITPVDGRLGASASVVIPML